MMTASVVDWGDILSVVWASLLAGVGLVTAGSLAIYGGARANSERRDGNAGTATFFAVLGVVGLLICAGGVVLGVSVMLSKG